jgi:hypothetical protein
MMTKGEGENWKVPKGCEKQTMGTMMSRTMGTTGGYAWRHPEHSFRGSDILERIQKNRAMQFGPWEPNWAKPQEQREDMGPEQSSSYNDSLCSMRKGDQITCVLYLILRQLEY